MADAHDRAEGLDDDAVDRPFPPDQLLGAEAYGEAGAQPGAPESVEPRAAREEPEERLLEPLPIAAEDAALHLVDESLGGFDSEIDDPALAAAHEFDPEPER